MKLSPDALLFAFSPWSYEEDMLVPHDSIAPEDTYYELTDPNADKCEQCGAARLTARAYGEPAFRVIAHFVCKHTGQWVAPQLEAA